MSAHYPARIMKILKAHDIDPPETKLPIYIDSSMRSSFVSCERKFFYEYVLNRSPDERSIHLHAGGAFAKGCEVVRNAYYKKKLDWDEAITEGEIAADELFQQCIHWIVEWQVGRHSGAPRCAPQG